MSFKKLFDDFYVNLTEHFLTVHSEITVNELKSRLNSVKAKRSAAIINKLFSENGAKDSNGNDLYAADPSTITNISIKNDVIVLSLTHDQKVFLQSDPIYGLNAMGIKYKDK